MCFFTVPVLFHSHNMSKSLSGLSPRPTKYKKKTFSPHPLTIGWSRQKNQDFLFQQTRLGFEKPVLVAPHANIHQTCFSHLSIQGLWKRGVQSDRTTFEVEPISVLSSETQTDAIGSRVSVDTEVGYEFTGGAVLSDCGKHILTTEA